MKFTKLCALLSALFRFNICLFVLVLTTRWAAAETVTFTFEDANAGPTFGIEYGSLDGFPTLVRDGFVIDVAKTVAINSVHFHETDSTVNFKVPDRPNVQRGVLWRDGGPGRDPLFFVPETPTLVFSLQNLVIGASSADGSQITGVELAAYLGSNLLATVPLATPTDAYTSYSGNALSVLDSLFMDRLEVIAIGSGAISYYMLDDVVFETAPIPEPSTVLLVAMASVGLLLRRRR